MPNINPAMLVMQALGAGQPLNKDAHQLQTMAQNMAKERGIDLGDLMRSLGISK